MWGKDVATDYRALYERELGKSALWLEDLCKALKTIRSQQKGMHRQARRMKRVRAEGSTEQRVEIARLAASNARMALTLNWLDRRGGLGSDVHDRIRSALIFVALGPDFVGEKDLASRVSTENVNQ